MDPSTREPSYPVPDPPPRAAGAGEVDLETVTRAIDSGRPLAETLDLIVERARVLLDSADAILLLADEAGLTGAAQRGLDVDEPAAIRFAPGESVEGWVAVHRRPLVIQNPAADARFVPLAQRRHPIAAIIALPLLARGEVLGVFTATSAIPTDFGEHLTLLLVLVDLATLAIERSRNLAREVRRNRVLDLLRFVSDANYAGDLPQVLAPVADRISAVLGTEKIDVLFRDAARNALLALGVSRTPLGDRQRALGLDVVPLPLLALEQSVLDTGRSILVPDAKRDPRVYRPYVDDLDIRSLILSPLEVGGERRGILAAASTQPHAFAEEDRAILDLVARRLSQALQHLALSEDLRRLEAERLDRLARDQFLDLLLHDLRNPLTAIKGYVQLAQRRLQRGDLAYQEHAWTVVDERVDHMARLLEDIENVVRLTTGTFSVKAAEFDLVALLRAEVDAVQAGAPRHVLSLAAPERLTICADRNRLAEVVQNLLSNAVRYSPAGGPIVVQAHETEGRAEIAVCDRGIGIPPDELAQVFERAYRGRESAPGTGRGLGLFISREIVRLHSGRLWAEARPGGGTCFRVELPVGGPD